MSFFDEDDEPRRSTRPAARVGRHRRRRSPDRARASGRAGRRRPACRPDPASSSSAAARTTRASAACATTTRAPRRSRRSPTARSPSRSSSCSTTPRASRRPICRARSPAIAARPSSSSSRRRTSTCPTRWSAAHRSLLEALEFRRDGLDAIASHITAALSDDAEAADPAIAAITGQMQAFLASDVIYSARVRAADQGRARQGRRDRRRPSPPRSFLPGVEWLSASYVADKLGAQAPAGSGSSGRRQAGPRPARHRPSERERRRRDAPDREPEPHPGRHARVRDQVHEPGHQRRDRRPGRAARSRAAPSRSRPRGRSTSCPRARPLRRISSFPGAAGRRAGDDHGRGQAGHGEKKTDNNKAEYQALFTG